MENKWIDIWKGCQDRNESGSTCVTTQMLETSETKTVGLAFLSLNEEMDIHVSKTWWKENNHYGHYIRWAICWKERAKHVIEKLYELKLQAKKEQYGLGSIDLTAHQLSSTDANRKIKELGEAGNTSVSGDFSYLNGERAKVASESEAAAAGYWSQKKIRNPWVDIKI